MKSEERILKGRFLDLANQSYRQNFFTYTDFLGLSEQAIFYSIKNEISHIPYKTFGGAKDCERIMIRFGDEEALGYEGKFPIDCILITPLMEKFADNLTHRDCLGALMNLGIERSILGDIVLLDNQIFLFCKKSISEFLIENLFKIRHTNVKSQIYDGDMLLVKPNLVPIDIQVASLRMDAIVAKVFKMSREKSLDLFRSGRVFLNGRQVTENALKPKFDDIISVRGYGRVRLVGEGRTTKKGNLILKLMLFA